MNYSGDIVNDISRLLEFFRPYCADRETLDWLHSATTDRAKWQKAHGVFSHIRNKTLKAERQGNLPAVAQYLFEEICAKTLYNLSGASAPFDSDSPYWVLPNAIAFARQIDVSDAAVVACVSLQVPRSNDA